MQPNLMFLMEPDADLRATVCSAIEGGGLRVEPVATCADVLAWHARGGEVPVDFLLALGVADLDPDWETLRRALDEDPALARAGVIILLTIRNGLRFPKRARIVQKPFDLDALVALIATDA